MAYHREPRLGLLLVGGDEEAANLRDRAERCEKADGDGCDGDSLRNSRVPDIYTATSVVAKMVNRWNLLPIVILLFDDEKRRGIKLPWIPARLVLDRNGRLRMREYGYSQGSELLFEKKLRVLLSP